MLHEPWRIRLFGGLRLQQQLTVIERFRTRKAAALLAYLAFYSHRQHSREELAERFWPDENHSGEAKAHNLNQALSTLRRYLEPTPADKGTVLRSTHTHIALNREAIVVDVAEFEAAVRLAARSSEDMERGRHLAQAVSLYAGDLLPGMYEEWALLERERLREQYTRTLLQLAEHGDERSKFASSPLLKAPPLLPLSPALLSANISPTEEVAQTPASITHLPLTLTAFFGRETEMRQAGLLLESARLLTFTGAGGSGKTRLAVEIGRDPSTRFDTVVFVALADVANPLDLLPAVADALASALHQRETIPAPASSANQDVLAHIQTLLATRRALLILDNFEHLVEAAPSVPDLLAGCPLLSCLITSRCALHLNGEHVLAVAPFPCPQDILDLDELQTRPSIQLFLNRAQAVRSDFRLTPRNAPLLAGLCGDLDGLPLALELAAARIGTFSLSEMRQQLADGKQRFQLLVSRHRDTHHRHHSLTAALGWSYCQLTPAQQRFFARLSLLHGDWTANAAHAVGGFADKHDTRDALEQLCSASLIVTNTGECEINDPTEATFHLLETMRQFGQQQLTPEEAEEAAQHHAQFYLRQAETHAADSDPKTEGAWLARMEQAAPNLRAALDWCFRPEGDEATGLRLCSVLTRFWFYRCHYAEGLRYFNLALAADSGRQHPVLRADALHGAALFAARLNHYGDAVAWAQACLRLRRESGDRGKIAHCLQNLAHYVWCLHDPTAAETYHREALVLYKELEDLEGIGRGYGGLGAIAENRGDVESAENWRLRHLGIARQSGNTYAVACALVSLSGLAACQEQWARAKSFAEEAFAIHETRRDEYQMAYARMGLARACLGLDEWNAAEAHLQAAVAALERLGDRSGLAGAHRWWAKLRYNQGKRDTARLHLQQCFTLLLQLQEPLSIGKIAEQWIVRTFDRADAPRLLPLLSALDAQQTVEPYCRFPVEQRYWDACIAKARVFLGATPFQRAWDKGRMMAWNEALGLILTLRCIFAFLLFNTNLLDCGILNFSA